MCRLLRGGRVCEFVLCIVYWEEEVNVCEFVLFVSVWFIGRMK